MDNLNKIMSSFKKKKISDNFSYNDLAILVAMSYFPVKNVNDLEKVRKELELDKNKGLGEIISDWKNKKQEISGVNVGVIVNYLEQKNILTEDEEEDSYKIAELFEEDHYLVESHDYAGQIGIEISELSYGYSSISKALEILNDFKKFKTKNLEDNIFFDFRDFYDKNYSALFR